MTKELEGRMQNRCNLSEMVKESAVKNERIEAIKRMIKANITSEQIISCGYTEEEMEMKGVKQSMKNGKGGWWK